jgi:hypothetical protein
MDKSPMPVPNSTGIHFLSHDIFPLSKEAEWFYRNDIVMMMVPLKRQIQV